MDKELEEKLRHAFQAGFNRGAFVESNAYSPFDQPLTESEYIESLNPKQDDEELIPITYGFIKNTFGWSRFCDVTNHNHYAINERGEPDLNDTFNVTKEQLDKLI
jgi:hypothetical protein